MKSPTKKQIDQLRIALGMSGFFSINNVASELILVTQSEIERLGDQFSLRDAARLRVRVEKKYEKYNEDQIIESAERIKTRRKKQLKSKVKKR